MDNLEAMRVRFNNQVLLMKLQKGKNNQLFTKSEYFSFLAHIKERKELTSGKTPKDYQRLARYDIFQTGSVERLIVPVKNERNPIIYYTFVEENFQIIHEMHIALGHGGRNKLMKELRAKFKNITAEIIMIYLNLCETCQNKKRVAEKCLVVKPIESSELSSRCQIDLIDMRSQADGDYKFIMVYQDYLTKFIQLRALKTQQAQEVACHLLDVFSIFGAPCILQSVNDQKFAIEVIEEVCRMWEELKIVHGNWSHSFPQDLVGTANQDVKHMLSTWLEKNNTSKWSEGLKFIQFMKNRTHDSTIGRSPHEAIFGCKARLGLRNYLPEDVLSGITSEEDLAILSYHFNNEAHMNEVITMEEGDIGRVNDDSMEVELEDSKENLKLITFVDPEVVQLCEAEKINYEKSKVKGITYVDMKVEIEDSNEDSKLL